ncbi:MAG: response regulator transcription factor [Oscillospiraceae bacterium]|nr:response regulator transcription factor [Oscillospiraceae bacterium]
MKFAVCDDEREIADLVSEKLREFYPDECEIKSYVDGKTLLADSVRELFDAFFLDIEMPGLDGFTLVEKIRADNPFAKIIFVTKNTELAHIGYLYGAFRYVRKFALEEELREAALSLKREFDLQSEFLLLKTPFGEVIRAVNSIRYFEVKGHQVTAFFGDTEERVSGTMNEYEARLKNVGFIRIHKSFLVNFRFIEYVGKTTVTLIDGSTLALSRNRVAETKRKLLIFSRNKVQLCSNNPVKNF